jgi:hypothetical protein
VALPRTLISADSHLMEPLDLWTRHLPAGLRERGPRLEHRDGGTWLVVEEMPLRRFGPLVEAERGEAGEGKGFVAGASELGARLRDLDRDGVFGEVIYPNLGFFACFHIRDAALQAACARAYNDWVADLFLTYLCGSGVLERHPRLSVVMVECGAGWLAWALHAMDDAYREHARWVRPKLAMLPSEYFRRQGHVTFQSDPVGLADHLRERRAALPVRAARGGLSHRRCSAMPVRDARSVSGSSASPRPSASRVR